MAGRGVRCALSLSARGSGSRGRGRDRFDGLRRHAVDGGGLRGAEGERLEERDAGGGQRPALVERLEQVARGSRELEQLLVRVIDRNVERLARLLAARILLQRLGRLRHLSRKHLLPTIPSGTLSEGGVKRYKYAEASKREIARTPAHKINIKRRRHS